jgi:LacI family transcriptional regulator
VKQKISTIRDVAKLAGVSPITVSRVINNAAYISEETRRKVEEAIATLDYVPNTLSQSLRFKKTHTIALIISDITNPFWTTISRGVEDASSEQNLHVIICNTDERREKLENYINLLLQRRVDGMLIAPSEENAPEVIARIQKQHVPLVVLDRAVPGLEVDVVRSDSVQGAYELTRYLLELGHRRIAMLTGPLGISTSWQRVQGYRKALQDHGLAVDESLIVRGVFRQDGGYSMTQTVMQSPNPPTALFTANNFIALGSLKALNEMNLRIPDDVSMVSFDEMPFDGYQKPFMTLAAQAPYEMGFQAARLLVKLMQGEEKPGGRDILLPIQIMIRQSCRAIS